MTRISVAMCTFNGARFLDEQLASIAAQTRLPDELVVVDDGSVDATMDLLSAFAATAPFEVRIDHNDRTLGSTKNFDGALARCTGDILVLCDQDDVWLPDRLLAAESVLQQRPDVGLVVCDATLIDEDGRPLGRSLWEQLEVGSADLEVLQSPHAVDLLLEGRTIAGATMAFRRAFCPLVLPIPDDLPMLHDGWIAVLVAAASLTVPLHEPLVCYRQHDAQQNGGKGSPIVQGISEARRRAEAWTHLLVVGSRVHDRLVEHRSTYDVGAAAALLDARLAHARFRSDLPTGLLARAGGAARELASGRYHRYSNGLRSAARDLLGAS